MYIILLSILAIYYASRTLSTYDGPVNLFAKLRAKSRLTRCFWCVSVWLSILPALYTANNWQELIIYTFAIAAGANIINELVDR